MQKVADLIPRNSTCWVRRAELAKAGQRLTAEAWSLLRHGDWVDVDQQEEVERSKCDPEWPAVRCAQELVKGKLPRIGFEEALTQIQWKPALVKDAHLLQGAQERWSLDFFSKTCPPAGTPEASLFSVYRAPEPSRRFRYARAEAGEDGFGLGPEPCAEELFLDFHEFAGRKRAAAEGVGDGFAYYLWGVVLRRAEDRHFEGFNLGQEVDEDLAEEQTWTELRRLQAAGAWADFEQAQLFIGCRDALTPCHYDLLHNAYVQVKGWKRFLLIDPSYSYGLYPYPQGHPMDRCARADLEHPDYQSFPKLAEVRAVEALMGPGDVLILPSGWYHHVQSLSEDSLSVSFWFTLPPQAPAQAPLSSLERLLLQREVEKLLLLLHGAPKLAQSFRRLCGMWSLEAKREDPQAACLELFV